MENILDFLPKGEADVLLLLGNGVFSRPWDYTLGLVHRVNEALAK